MQAVKDWFQAFLQARGMDKPNGKMLFQYRASFAEYQQLRDLISARFAALNGAPWRYESHAESALFVLYASEWWRREYAGGAWRWTSIFQSITTGPYRVEPLERSTVVELGLRAWGHRLSEDGKKYLGAIVAQGGLPLKMVARGDGVTSRLLLSATHKAQLLGWSEYQLVDYFESHADDLVQHLRATEIYRLLTEMVTTVLTLRNEYKLAGVSNPVAALEQLEPRWRERFPIAVDDQSVEPLLVGLVREVSRPIKLKKAYPVSISRTLIKLAEADSYVLSMGIQVPSTISLEALAAAIEIPSSKVPQSFVLEMAGDQRISLAQGRQLLGAQVSAVLFTGKARRFLGMEACQEVLLAIRSVGTDIVSPTSVPGGEALDGSQPWCFTTTDETLTLTGVGSCKVVSEVAYVLAPDHFTLTPHENACVVLEGLVEDLPEPRWMYKVQGTVDIFADDEIYCVTTNVLNGSDQQLVWKGSRHWCHSSPFPVFLGVPRLYRVDIEGQSHAVSDKDIEWVLPVRKGSPLANVKGHRGPADAWLLMEGMRQRRFRMVLVAPDARIAFKSGASECEGSIEFHGWGITALHAAAELSPESSVEGNLGRLSMRALNHPPALAPVTAEWSSTYPVLRIDLPFPSTGGRFARSDGSVLPNGSSLPMRRIQNLHVQVFDRNPNLLKSYRLEMQLQGDLQSNRLRRAEIDVPLDANGVGDIRFFEIESVLNSLFCQSDHLDACLHITLFAGSAAIRTLRLTRYDVELERESQSLIIPRAQFVNVPTDQLQGMELRAIPLLEQMQAPYDLEQLRSGDNPVGIWSVAQLPAGHSPWLIYPSKNSSLQARPTLWSASAFDLLGRMQTLEDTLCPLAEAMSASSEEVRSRHLAKVVAEMTTDLDHRSWKLVSHHYHQLKHLPLNTLDYWRLIGRNQDACLAAVLKFPGEIYELMQRMRDELGVMWEFTSRTSLQKAYEAFSMSMTAQLGPTASADLIDQLLIDLFTKIGFSSEPLAIQSDRILFERTGTRSARFDRLIADFQRTPGSLLQHLWQGEDCLLQRVLLRNHAHEKIWPYFKLTEELVREILSQKDRQYVNFVSDLGKQLLWMPSSAPGGSTINVKVDVANAPLLTGYLVQICDANKWLQSSDHLAALRQIKAFDPTWFDLGIQIGSLLAMKATEHRAHAHRAR